MKSRKTLTVGIPAYNEEQNITHILHDITNQKLKNSILEQIIVVSDGSTDSTAWLVKKLAIPNLTVIERKARRGRALCQNEIMQKSNSDILVLLDADIALKDPHFLQTLIQPIADEKADITTASMRELEPKTFMEKLLIISMDFKRQLFETYNKGINIYTCNGRGRAFGKNLYKQISFKESVNEDAYSYMYAIFNNYRYQHVKNAILYYRLPTNLHDHQKQSIRFYHSKNRSIHEFGEPFVTKSYYLPKELILKLMVRYTWKNPLILIYYFINLLTQVKSRLVSPTSNIWDLSASSKQLR